MSLACKNETLQKEKKIEFEKPSFVPSGKLAEDTNIFKGVLIKYNEPPEAKIPKVRWRMYQFKVRSVKFTIILRFVFRAKRNCRLSTSIDRVPT